MFCKFGLLFTSGTAAWTGTSTVVTVPHPGNGDVFGLFAEYRVIKCTTSHNMFTVIGTQTRYRKQFTARLQSGVGALVKVLVIVSMFATTAAGAI